MLRLGSSPQAARRAILPASHIPTPWLCDTLHAHHNESLHARIPAAFFIWFIIGIATMAFLVLTVVFHKRIFSPIPVRL